MAKLHSHTHVAVSFDTGEFVHSRKRWGVIRSCELGTHTKRIDPGAARDQIRDSILVQITAREYFGIGHTVVVEDLSNLPAQFAEITAVEPHGGN